MTSHLILIYVSESLHSIFQQNGRRETTGRLMRVSAMSTRTPRSARQTLQISLTENMVTGFPHWLLENNCLMKEIFNSHIPEGSQDLPTMISPHSCSFGHLIHFRQETHLSILQSLMPSRRATIVVNGFFPYSSRTRRMTSHSCNQRPIVSR